MTVKKFEDLEIWQNARELCREVYRITSDGPFSHDFKMRDQIRASAGSVMDNIAEGFNRGGNKEFSQFLSISLGSIGEVRSQIYRAYDVKYLDEDTCKDLLEKTDSIGRKIYSLMEYIRTSDIKGRKFSSQR